MAIEPITTDALFELVCVAMVALYELVYCFVAIAALLHFVSTNRCLTLHRDYVIAGGSNGVLYVWSLATQHEVFRKQAHSGGRAGG